MQPQHSMADMLDIMRLGDIENTSTHDTNKLRL